MACKGWTRRTPPPGVDNPDGMTWMPGKFVRFIGVNESFGSRIESEQWVITIVDLDADQAAEIFCENHINDDSFENYMRITAFDPGKLPLGIRYALQTTGRAEVTLAQLRLAANNVFTHRAEF